ncbi:MAG: flagellar protein FliS [Ignavibacteria bacterium]|jgi:flagellar protein FliS|nr:flagellar protein FliS [Ignavibacteria bacterium]MCU7519713.1 flagellar protein FliS [Ignavibacteria bacterium]HEX2960344.1 flagellar export chaperone FliS [Ignavibacteriales bacterium]
MYSTAYARPAYNKANQYLAKEILEATPQQLLIKIYDFAIVNCQKHDMVRTNNAIQELINSLSFDRPDVSEISNGLLRLYKFCQDQMRQQNYDIVHKILSELRDTWMSAFEKK